MILLLNSLPDTTQVYELNQRAITIDLGKLPILSRSTKEFLERQPDGCLPIFEPKLAGSLRRIPLDQHVQLIQSLEKQIEETVNHKTRDQLFVVGQSIFLAAFGAGVIFAAVFSGAPQIALIGLFLYAAISLYLAHNAGAKMGMVSFRMKFFGISMPLYEVFTRKARLETLLERQKSALRQEIVDCQEDVRRVLPEAYQCYKDGKIERIFDHIRELENKASGVEKRLKMGRMSALQKRVIQSQASEWKEIKKDLSAYVEFLQQFDSPL